MGRILNRESPNRPIKLPYQVEKPTPERLLGYKKSKLSELMKDCYHRGYSGEGLTWPQAQDVIAKYIEGLQEIKEVESQIGHYSRLIASKETSKAA